MTNPEIDAKVALEVMGYGETEKCWVVYGYTKPYHLKKTNFRPSSIISDAMKVAEKFPHYGVCKSGMKNELYYTCWVWNELGQGFSSKAETAPLAICFAAMKAIGVEIEACQKQK